MRATETVDIKALKNKLGEYVRVAAAGQTVLVTDRGKVVAELVLPRGPASASLAERRLAGLAELGLLTPAKTPPKTRPPRHKPLAGLAKVLGNVDKSRAER